MGEEINVICPPTWEDWVLSVLDYPSTHTPSRSAVALSRLPLPSAAPADAAPVPPPSPAPAPPSSRALTLLAIVPPAVGDTVVPIEEGGDVEVAGLGGLPRSSNLCTHHKRLRQRHARVSSTCTMDPGCVGIGQRETRVKDRPRLPPPHTMTRDGPGSSRCPTATPTTISPDPTPGTPTHAS